MTSPSNQVDLQIGTKVIRLKSFYDGVRCTPYGVALDGHCPIPAGSKGKIVSVNLHHAYKDARMVFWVPQHNTWVRIDSGFSYQGKTWDVVHAQQASTFIIQSEGVMELYQAASTEVIEGVVPQVRYGAAIVWQGDPVAVEEDGEELSLDKQHQNAIKTAQDKITDVVKKQFQA